MKQGRLGKIENFRRLGKSFKRGVTISRKRATNFIFGITGKLKGLEMLDLPL